MFRRMKVIFFITLVTGVISLVYLLFYSSVHHSSHDAEKGFHYFGILKSKVFSGESTITFLKKLEKKGRDSKTNKDETTTVRNTSKIEGVREPISSTLETKLNHPSVITPSSLSNGAGGDAVDVLIETSLEQNKKELHSQADEDDDDSTTTLSATQETIVPTNPVEEPTESPSLKSNSEEDEDVELCPEKPQTLTGPLYVNQVVPKMEDLEKHLSASHGAWVLNGGAYRPTQCKARVKMALIIPFRMRYKQLGIFVRHMHPMLKRQQVDYRIFIIEQSGNTPFNRAILFNIGYKESLKFKNFDCFIFHDVDLIPEDDRNLYTCPTSPRHMSVAVDKFNYRLPYATIFGGAGAFTKKDFEEINGFSNKFWGWGGEDDDAYQRVVAKGHHLTRPSLLIGRYKMVRIHHHQSSKADPNSGAKLRNSRIRMLKDGLNSLKYKVIKIKEEPMYTLITIEVNQKWV